MRLTNKLGLPESLVEAVRNDPYDRGNCDFSITQLLKPPKISYLTECYKDELEEDVSDRLYSLYGQIVHSILERAKSSDLKEKRFFAKVGSWTISAQIDNLAVEDGILTDYKFTTVYKFMANKQPDPDWIAQLNAQRWLMLQNGVESRELQIVGLLRDWRPREQEKDKNYPNTQIAKMSIPVWSEQATEIFLRQRIALHSTETPRPCSTTDTWGGKRCEKYCAVNKYCDQYN